MAKSRGLPPSFQIEVSREALIGPVQLGDYLDEEVRRPVTTPQARHVATPQPAVRPHLQQPPAPLRQLTTPPPPSAPSYEPKVVSMRPAVVPRAMPPQPVEDEEAHVSEGILRRPVKGPPRKQVNMNPETLRMVDELLTQIQTFSGQKDAKASEMFHALVSALYEARELLDLSSIQPRGRWGTPMARAFPISLKNTFQAAIAEWFRRNGS